MVYQSQWSMQPFNSARMTKSLTRWYANAFSFPLSASSLKLLHLKEFLRYTADEQQKQLLVHQAVRFESASGRAIIQCTALVCSARLVHSPNRMGIRSTAAGEVLRPLVAKVAQKLSIQKADASAERWRQGNSHIYCAVYSLCNSCKQKNSKFLSL